jgi:hypothetical protein
LEDLRGYTIRAGEDDIGKVKDIYIDDRHWTVRYVVVDTGSWLRERQVLVSPVALAGADWATRRFDVDLTRQQIEQSPTIDQDLPVSRKMEHELTRYYNWPVYWDVHVMHPPAAVTPSPTPAVAERRLGQAGAEGVVSPVADPETPSLRSLREVSGYRIEAADGSIGQVDDLIGDDESWRVHYLVVDTRRWLPGKKVLVATDWVETIDWSNARVVVDLERGTIKDSPEFDPSEPLNRKYEQRLYDFYGRPDYWS